MLSQIFWSTLLVICVGWQDQLPTDILTPTQAINKIGSSTVRVQFVVKHAKDRLAKRGVVYLDSEEDFENAENLGVALSVAATEELKAKGVEDFEAHFLGKKVEVCGCVMRFEDRPYLPVLRADQIRVVNEE
ncbi:MAG TPA: hypothetical protein PKD64_03560 [Pirellulaceae bacterium]|nr:hypothetical protein [Pirellulaceae bacterium]HMO91248.1 hypothetical protein [Pirellulaceae bacterium]HMP68568.1 hypothetical protein [Pirellulaceae bacterium]